MAFLDFLGPALTTATQAATAVGRGQQLRADDERAKLLQDAQLKRQADQDAIQQRIRERQIQSQALRDQIAVAAEARAAAKPVPWAPSSEEEYLRVHPRNIDPLSPQGIQAATQRAGRIAQAEAPYKNGGSSAQPSLKNTTSLTTRYQAEKIVKDAQDIAQYYAGLKSALAQGTAAGDIASIYSFMKIYDPGSVVREGEFATAQNAAGVPDQIRNAYNRALRGERLNPSQRKQFLETAKAKVDTQRRLLQGINQKYTTTAQRFNVIPEDVVADPFMFDQALEQSGNRQPSEADEYAEAAKDYKDALQEPGANKAELQQWYNQAVMEIARKYGKVK